MARKGKTQKEKEQERQIRRLSTFFVERGVQVRREKLSRGSAFRVKSGDYVLSGDDYIFVDKRLPVEQQYTVLMDRILDIQDQLSDSDLELLPDSARQLLEARA